MPFYYYIIVAVISYLLGSLNFGVILSRRLARDDVRNHGSGNAGTTNMLRNYGKKFAVLTMLGDMIKVFAAIAAAFVIFKNIPVTDISTVNIDISILIKSYAGFFCVLGHIFPCYFGFKGGKGVATAGGMVFAVDWRIALILLAVFAVVLLITNYVSLGSIIMAILYPVLIFLFYGSIALTMISVVFTVIVIIAHRGNIKKLINHTENKISFKKK